MKLKIEKAPFGAATPTGGARTNKKIYLYSASIAQIGVNEH